MPAQSTDFFLEERLDKNRLDTLTREIQDLNGTKLFLKPSGDFSIVQVPKSHSDEFIQFAREKAFQFQPLKSPIDQFIVNEQYPETLSEEDAAFLNRKGFQTDQFLPLSLPPLRVEYEHINGAIGDMLDTRPYRGLPINISDSHWIAKRQGQFGIKNNYVWRGEILGEPGDISIRRDGKSLLGYIRSQRGYFEILNLPSGRIGALQIKGINSIPDHEPRYPRFDSPATNDRLLAPFLRPFHSNFSTFSIHPGKSISDFTVSTLESPSTIRIVIVFSQKVTAGNESRQWSMDKVQSIHDSLNTNCNDSRARDGVNAVCAGIQFQLVFADDFGFPNKFEIEDDKRSSLIGTLRNLINASENKKQPPPVFSQIVKLREASKADILVLVRKQGPSCGETQGFRNKGDKHSAFAVVRGDCADARLTITHEVRHILGAHHENTTPAVPFDFAKAYLWDCYGKLSGTVMVDGKHCENSCAADSSENCCIRQNIWSSRFPNISSCTTKRGGIFNNNYRALSISAKDVSEYMPD